MHAYEGPNELDSDGDTNFASDDVTLMSRLSAARGSSFPSSVILLAPSLADGCTSYQDEAQVGNDKIASSFDQNNAHVYFGAEQPENSGTGAIQCGIGHYGTEYTFINQALIPAPKKPIAVTETGYPDDCCSYSDSGYVSPTFRWP